MVGRNNISEESLPEAVMKWSQIIKSSLKFSTLYDTQSDINCMHHGAEGGKLSCK